MAYGEPRHRGIYCIETVWGEPKDRTSVRGALEILDSARSAPYVHRDAATTAEFHFYLEEWLSGPDHAILYLCFHGSEGGKLWFQTVDGSADLVNDEVISERLIDRCKNRAVHFGTCSVLDDMDAMQFLEATRASAVSGYRKDVDWMQSTAFDLLLLDELQYHGQKSLTPTVARTARVNLLGEPYAQLGEHLGFEMLVAGD